MIVKFWGTRGSIPVPEPDCIKYGGDTSCVSVHSSDNIIILDAGTGIRKLGSFLMNDPSFSGIASIFLSHSHWDHIQGFPFFKPAFMSGNEVHIYGAFRADQRLHSALKGQMGTIYFPVPMEALPSSLKFIELLEEDVVVGSFSVRARALNHPGGCFGYRISDGTNVIAYCTDTEPYENKVDEKVIELAMGADLLIYDAQFTPEEYATNRKGWGHSTWQDAIKIAHEANVKQLVLFHHDPYHSDTLIDEIVREAQVFFPNTIAASRGLELELGRFSLKDSQIMIDNLTKSRQRKQESTSDFKISFIENCKTTVVNAPVDLSVFNSSDFSTRINTQIQSGNTVKLVLNMSSLNFIDSSGLGALASLNEGCRKQGITMVLCSVSPQIQKVLEITRINRIMGIATTEQEALAMK